MFDPYYSSKSHVTVCQEKDANRPPKPGWKHVRLRVITLQTITIKLGQLGKSHTLIQKKIPLLTTSLQKSMMQESGFTVTICMPTKRSITSCSRAGMDSVFRSAKFIKREFNEKRFFFFLKQILPKQMTVVISKLLKELSRFIIKGKTT